MSETKTTIAPPEEAKEAVANVLLPDIKPEVRKKSDDYSKPAVIRTLTLNTNVVQKLFEHRFKRTNNALYIATKAARDQRRASDAQQAEEKLKNIFDEFSVNLSTVSAQQQNKLEQKVPKELQTIVYDHKRTYQVPVRTGFAMRFINLTEMLDDVVAKIETLEINNVLNSQVSAKSTRSWVTRYQAFCTAIEAVKAQSLPKRQMPGN